MGSHSAVASLAAQTYEDLASVCENYDHMITSVLVCVDLDRQTSAIP